MEMESGGEVAGAAKADVVVPDTWVPPVATGAMEAPGSNVVAPERTTTQHARLFPVVPILHPLGHIARHVRNAFRRRAGGEQPNWRGVPYLHIEVRFFLVRTVVSPRVNPPVEPRGRAAPLRGARQSYASPGAKGHRLMPAHASDRPVGMLDLLAPVLGRGVFAVSASPPRALVLVSFVLYEATELFNGDRIAPDLKWLHALRPAAFDCDPVVLA